MSFELYLFLNKINVKSTFLEEFRVFKFNRALNNETLKLFYVYLLLLITGRDINFKYAFRIIT